MLLTLNQVTRGLASAEADVALHGTSLPSAFPSNSGFHPIQHSAAPHHPAQHAAAAPHHPAQHAAAGGHHASHAASGHHASHGAHGGGGGHHAPHGGSHHAHPASHGGHGGHGGGSSYSAPPALAPVTDHHKEGICTDVR